MEPLGPSHERGLVQGFARRKIALSPQTLAYLASFYDEPHGEQKRRKDKWQEEMDLYRRGYYGRRMTRRRSSSTNDAVELVENGNDQSSDGALRVSQLRQTNTSHVFRASPLSTPSRYRTSERSPSKEDMRAAAEDLLQVLRYLRAAFSSSSLASTKVFAGSLSIDARTLVKMIDERIIRASGSSVFDVLRADEIEQRNNFGEALIQDMIADVMARMLGEREMAWRDRVEGGDGHARRQLLRMKYQLSQIRKDKDKILANLVEEGKMSRAKYTGARMQVLSSLHRQARYQSTPPMQNSVSSPVSQESRYRSPLPRRLFDDEDPSLLNSIERRRRVETVMERLQRFREDRERENKIKQVTDPIMVRPSLMSREIGPDQPQRQTRGRNEEELKRLERELAVNKSKLDELEARNASEMKQQREEIASLKHVIQSLTTQASRPNPRAIEAIERAQKAWEETKKLETARIAQTVDRIQKEAEKVRNDATLACEIKDELVSDLREENARLENVRAQTANALAEQTSKTHQLQQVLQQHQDRIRALESQIQMSEQDNRKLEQMQEQLEQERQARARLEQQALMGKQTAEEMIAIQTQYKVTLEDAKSRLVQAENEKEALESQIHVVQSENEKLRKDLEMVVAQKNEEIRHLKTQIEENPARQEKDLQVQELNNILDQERAKASRDAQGLQQEILEWKQKLEEERQHHRETVQALETEHASVLEFEQEEHAMVLEQELVAARASFDRELKQIVGDLKDEYENRFRTRNQFDVQLSERLKAEMEDIRSGFQREMTALKQEHEQELEATKQQFQIEKRRMMKSLKAQHENEIETLLAERDAVHAASLRKEMSTVLAKIEAQSKAHEQYRIAAEEEKENALESLRAELTRKLQEANEEKLARLGNDCAEANQKAEVANGEVKKLRKVLSNIVNTQEQRQAHTVRTLVAVTMLLSRIRTQTKRERMMLDHVVHNRVDNQRKSIKNGPLEDDNIMIQALQREKLVLLNGIKRLHEHYRNGATVKANGSKLVALT